jgi:predicted enzyme related to lactoylglutathione lyase
MKSQQPTFADDVIRLAAAATGEQRSLFCTSGRGGNVAPLARFTGLRPPLRSKEVCVMGNPFVHVELMTTDVGKAKAFYGKLFEWKLEDMDVGDMTYTMIRVGDGTGGGLMKNPMPNASSMWVAYVNVDDVKAATTKAKSLGAKVMKDVTEVKNVGSFTIITDPTGAMLGLWQPKKG